MKRLAVGFFLNFLLAIGAAGSAASQEPPRHAQEEETGLAGEHETPTLDLWKLANFVLLAGALGYILYKRGGPFFRSRTEEIRRGLDEAARLKADAEAGYAETQRRLANLGEEIESLRRQAREESGAEGERVRRQIEADIRRIQAQAAQELAAASKAARQELRSYSAELAVGLAEHKIRERLTPEVQSELVGAMVQNLEREQTVRTS